MALQADESGRNQARQTPGSTRLARLAPGPKETFLLGNLPALVRKGLLRLFEDAWRESGDLFSLKMGPKRQYVITRPEHVKHLLATEKQKYPKGSGYKIVRESMIGLGLLTSDGAFWQRQRRLMQPLFTARAVTQFAGQMTDRTQEMLARWKPHAARGEPLDLSVEMMRLALSIIGTTMVSLDAGDETLELGRAFRTMMESMAHLSSGLPVMPQWVPTPRNRRAHAAARVLDTYIYRLIQERRTQQERPADLLTQLLEARDEETGEGMTDEQIRNEVLTIFLAGHDTTAAVLTWVWYLLATHPAIESNLHEELTAVLGGRTPTSDDLARLTYPRMIFEEALRLYPPGWIFPREAAEEDEIAGYRVPAGTLMLACPYLTHRQPAFWEHPEQFEPERFTAERSAQRPPYTYYPFGAGPHTCLGIHFALLEGQLILATVAQRYRLRLVPGFSVEVRSMGMLRPRHGLPIILQAREAGG